MPESNQTVTKAETETEESSLAKGMTPWKLELGKVLWQWIAGGATVGSLVTLINSTELPKIALGAAAGGALTGGGAIASTLYKPTGKKLKKVVEAAGNDLAENQFVKKPFEEQYWEAQTLACQEAKAIGIPQYDGIFVPLLEKVFVDLRLDGRASLPGLNQAKLNRKMMMPNEGGDWCDRISIWDLLKQAQKNTRFRRIALLGWGGYGKTTLLMQVAYAYGKSKYGKNQQKRGLDRKLPVLVLLRKYRKLLAKHDAPDLPQFIEQHHIPALPGGEDLSVPENWAKGILQRGRAIVLFDGLDEVPSNLRPGVVNWLNAQAKRYPKTTFVLTSRPKAYRELEHSTFAFSTAYWVQEFNQEQRQDFIKRWYLCQEVFARGGREDAAVRQEATQEAAALTKQIEQREELQDMAKNPLLLTMMATFHRRYNGADLPKQRVELYRDICQLQLKDRPRARKLESLLINCDTQRILQPLALEMMLQQTRRLPKDKILANFQQTLTANSEQLDAAEFLEQVNAVGELLIRQEEEYEFSHLSFQEYLAAEEIVRTQQEPLLYGHLDDSGKFADSWLRLMLLYVCLVNPTSLIREALRQGKPDFADQMYRETTKQIDDPALKTELEQGLKQAVKDSKYDELEKLLKAGEWEAADKETYRLMITTVGKEKGQMLVPDDLKNFPCEDLHTLNRLWLGASSGHFGFSVQKEIWEKCGSPISIGGDWDSFCVQVGWQEPIANSSLVNYSSLEKIPSLNSPGALPGFYLKDDVDVSFLDGEIELGCVVWEGVGYFSSLIKQLLDCSKTSL